MSLFSSNEIVQLITYSFLCDLICYSSPSLSSTNWQRLDPFNGHINQNLAFVFRDVSPEKICDGAFWFMLYRLLCFPSATTNAAALYGNLLPWLTGVPLGAHRNGGAGSGGASSSGSGAGGAAAGAGAPPSKPKRRWSAIGAPSPQAGALSNTTTNDDDDNIEWRRPPLSSDSSRCYCILETMFHVSCCLGCSVSQADATLVIVKAHIMRMLYLDLHAEGPTGRLRATRSHRNAPSAPNPGFPYAIHRKLNCEPYFFREVFVVYFLL